jgi:hypothetical protein
LVVSSTLAVASVALLVRLLGLAKGSGDDRVDAADDRVVDAR